MALMAIILHNSESYNQTHSPKAGRAVVNNKSVSQYNEGHYADPVPTWTAAYG